MTIAIRWFDSLDLIAPDQLASAVRFVGKYIRFLRFLRTLFLGSPCSEEGTVGLLPGVELAEIAVPLQRALNDRATECHASMIVWKDFIERDRSSLARLPELFSVVSFPGTKMPLPVGGFDGINYALSNAFLYFQLWAAAVDWASKRGLTEMQSGQTGYSAKLEIGNILVPLTNFARHRNPIIHKIFAWQAGGISWKTIDKDLAVHLAAHAP